MDKILAGFYYPIPNQGQNVGAKVKIQSIKNCFKDGDMLITQPKKAILASAAVTIIMIKCKSLHLKAVASSAPSTGLIMCNSAIFSIRNNT